MQKEERKGLVRTYVKMSDKPELAEEIEQLDDRDLMLLSDLVTVLLGRQVYGSVIAFQVMTDLNNILTGELCEFCGDLF